MLTVDASQSHVRIETEAGGLLAAVAHDLRIDAPVASGSSEDDAHCTLTFDVAKMRVVESSRHGADSWHAPSRSDADDIEGRIREELFAGCTSISAHGTLEGDRATIVVHAQKGQTVVVPVRVEREVTRTRATGRCELSLRALGTGKVKVPLGAIKLADRVVVTFDVSFAPAP